MAERTQIELIACPGCGRSVAAASTSCVYCHAELEGRAHRSQRPAANEDDGDATRCALCGAFYLTSKYPHGCPHCAATFADTSRLDAARDRKRRFALRLGQRALAAGIAFASGVVVARWIARVFPTFGSLQTASIVAAACVAALVAWRTHDHAALRGDPALLDAGAMFVAALVALAPWCFAAALWTNAFGLGGPEVIVRCRVLDVAVSPPDADYQLRCRLDDGTVLTTTISTTAKKAAPGSDLAQPVRRGRLGLMVSRRGIFEAAP